MIRDDIETVAPGGILPTLYYVGTTLQTWNGTPMLTVTLARTRRVGFGGSRTYLRARGGNGATYHGTTPGQEMYARMRRDA